MESTGVTLGPTVHKSIYDKKEYRLITLPNKLTALLISRANERTKTPAVNTERRTSISHGPQGGEHSEEGDEAIVEEFQIIDQDVRRPSHDLVKGITECTPGGQRRESLTSEKEEDWETEIDTDDNSEGGESEDQSDDDEGYGESGSEGSTGESDDEEEEEGGEEGNNGMRTAMGIQEQKPLQAAAAMCINVGSLSDHDLVPGLAHFLEHMVFMGNEKYPNENSFDEYVSKRGGSDNASTDWERTIFQFEVQEKYLASTLERFSWFFKSPLMNENCIEREIEAVDSEFQNAKPKDWARKDQLLAECAYDSHPIGKFLWGNRKSLVDLSEKNNIDVRKELFDFYREHYSANRCKLAIMGEASLDELQAMVLSSFGDMRNNDSVVPHFGEEGSKVHAGIDPIKFHKLCKVVPVKDNITLELLFAHPNMDHEYKSKPADYISHLLGHEGPGSVLALLKKREWAWALNAGVAYSDMTSAGHIFPVNIALTEEGLYHYVEVVAIVFQYLRLLQSLPLPEWVFEEKKILAQMAFDFQEPDDPIDFVEEISACIATFPAEDILTGSTLTWDFEPEVIKEMLTLMTPGQVRVTISCRKFEDECNLTEEWFGTKYCLYDFDPEHIALWNDSPIEDLVLPKKNEFLPESFALKADPGDAKGLAGGDPVLICDNAHGQLWWKIDNEFKLPRAYVYFHFISSVICRSPASSTMLLLLIAILGFNVGEIAYDAELAEISHVINPYNTGFTIKMTGFNDKLHVLFAKVIDALANFECPERYFKMAKKELIQSFKNKELKPAAVALDARLFILQEVRWKQGDKCAAMEMVTQEQLMTFKKDMLGSLYVQGLVQGNMTDGEANDLMNVLVGKIKPAVLPSFLFPLERVALLKPGVAIYAVPNHNPNDDNNLVENYYQIGEPTFRGRVINELLEYLMAEPCFNILRTTMQLGYDVSCAYRNTNGCLGFIIKVHSHSAKFTVAQIDEHIENFLEDYGRKLKKMDPENFAQHVRSMIDAKMMSDINLADEASRNWTEIFDNTCSFDRLKRESDTLLTITSSEVYDWFKKFLSRSSTRRKLSIRVLGKTEVAGLPETSGGKASGGEALKKKGSDGKRKTGIKQRPSFGKGKNGVISRAGEQAAALRSILEASKATIVDDLVSYKASLDLFPILRS